MQAGTTQEHLVSEHGRGAQDPTAHQGNHSEAGPEQIGVAIFCCCPTCLTAFTGMCLRVSDERSVNLEDLDVDFILQHFNLCLFVNKGNKET